ncbi:hypothetical protein JTB14_006617 [Gonioctena quinquepunctata]|nr:hypothetical protein JTB14_006617 [Gonioctena quinquepunctata]
MHPDNPNFEDWCVEQLRDDDNLISDDDQSIIMESDHGTESEQSGYEDVEEKTRKISYQQKIVMIFFMDARRKIQLHGLSNHLQPLLELDVITCW